MGSEHGSSCLSVAPCIAAAEPFAFELEDVRFDYSSGDPGLRAVSLAICRGQKVALLGANGSGKSTLLKILNGLVHPTSGKLIAFGEEVSERSLRDEARSFRFRQRVGFVFQNPDAQLFSSTVAEEIAFGPVQMGLSTSDVRKRVADVAAMLEIGPLLDRAPFRLSGGEKKKVALASVLVMNPDVVLLDEPTNGLDPRSQRWIVDILVRLHRAGKTVITATHDLDVVPEIADRAIVISENHEIAADRPVREILMDDALLLRVNLIHEHSHWHGTYRHSHPHWHTGEHAHEHSHPADPA